MLKLLLWRTFQIRKKRVLLTIAAVLMGSSLISAMIGVSAKMDKKVGKELRSYGSNLELVPQSNDYLKEDSLLKLKTIFWRHNLVGIAPIIKTKAQVGGEKGSVEIIGTWFDKQLKTAEGKFVKIGARDTFPWWKVKGKWPAAKQTNEVLIDEELANISDLKVGNKFSINKNNKKFDLNIVGIVKDSEYKSSIIGSTNLAQQLLGRKNIVDEVKISAMVVPKLKLPKEIRNKKATEMDKQEYRVWYCTPTVGAISTQIKEVVPDARVKNLRQFTETEGRLLSQIELMTFLTIIFSVLATILAVMTSTTAAVVERKGEIGLAKAIGASNTQIALQFIAELSALSFIGGAIGYFFGLGLAQFIGQAVFNTSVSFDALTLVATIVLALVTALLGSFQPIRKATKIQPVVAMRNV